MIDNYERIKAIENVCFKRFGKMLVSGMSHKESAQNILDYLDGLISRIIPSNVGLKGFCKEEKAKYEKFI